MAHSYTPNSQRIAAAKRIPIKNLKQCPLCDAVNGRQNTACFVCGWHGNFEYDPVAVERGLEAFFERCPDVVEILAKQTDSTSWLRSVVLRVSRRLRTRLDVRV